MTSAISGNKPFAHSAIVRLQSLAEKMLTRLKDARGRRAVYRATLNELCGLSHRDLADIGIHRSQIRRIAAESAKEAFPYV